MAIGQYANLGGLSYVAVGRETTSGTYNTCTASIDCLSASLVTQLDNKIIEQIEGSRTYSKRIALMKKVSGSLDFYYSPTELAHNYILQNAIGGSVTSATATGETAGAAGNSAITHTFSIGNMAESFSSLCINVRKGDGTNGQVFQYSGMKVNQIGFSANVDDALKVSAGFVGLDSTQNTNDVASILTASAYELLTFVDGRVSVETTFASLTSSSFWHVQSVEFGWSNNLKADADGGRIGSQVLTLLQAGMMNFNLKCKMRYDTTTAYDAMINATQLSVQLHFQGSTLAGSVIRRSVQFNFPKLHVNNSGDPTIGGPDQILTSDIDFHVLQDDSSSGGYAMRMLITNQTAAF